MKADDNAATVLQQAYKSWLHSRGDRGLLTLSIRDAFIAGWVYRARRDSEIATTTTSWTDGLPLAGVDKPDEIADAIKRDAGL